MIFNPKCETCGITLAAFHDADDAHEVAAYVTGSYCSESGDYTCESCEDARYREGMAMAVSYDAAMRQQWAREDAEAWRDEIFSNADLTYDLARDRGQI